MKLQLGHCAIERFDTNPENFRVIAYETISKEKRIKPWIARVFYNNGIKGLEFVKGYWIKASNEFYKIEFEIYKGGIFRYANFLNELDMKDDLSYKMKTQDGCLFLSATEIKEFEEDRILIDREKKELYITWDGEVRMTQSEMAYNDDDIPF